MYAALSKRSSASELQDAFYDDVVADAMSFANLLLGQPGEVITGPTGAPGLRGTRGPMVCSFI